MGNYRSNVGAILQRGDGCILVGERLAIANAWQFPQGGVDAGEDLIGALRREVKEELGVDPALYEIAACRTGYRYRFPAKHARKGIWTGQEQTYFLCRFLGHDSDINVETEHPEFSRFRWIEPAEFDLGWVVDFKREVYRELFRDFFFLDLVAR